MCEKLGSSKHQNQEPKVGIGESKMLTKQVLSKGDRVLIIETRSHRSPNPQTVVVDKVTKKFIYSSQTFS